MKTKTGFFALLFCVAGLLLIISCQSTKSSTASRMLKFNFEKGKGYDYEMVINMDQEINGAKQQIDMTTYYAMNVLEDNGTDKSISTTFERFKMNMVVMGFALDVDSDKPVITDANNNIEKNPLSLVSRVFGAIKGRQFLMKVDAEGNVKDLTGFKEMGQSIADSLGLDDEKKKQVLQAFNQQFNDNTIAEQFQRFLYIFPNKKVKVGDSWEKKTTTGGPLGAYYSSKYTVTDIEGDMVTLNEATEISAPPGQLQLKGKQTGTLVVDSNSGLVIVANMDLKMASGSNETNMNITGKTRIKGKARLN